MNSVLFQPFRLHDLTLPNRIVLSPMTRSRAGPARLPSLERDHHGVGLPGARRAHRHRSQP